jgi:excisionase family DNA binding protein
MSVDLDDFHDRRRLLTEPEAAAYLGTSVRQVRNLRYKRLLPYLKVGGSVRLIRDDLDDFLAQRTVAGDPVLAAARKLAKTAGPLTDAQIEQVAAILRGGR